MLGYHNRPDINSQVFDNEGYLNTGDAVTIDSDGFFYVVDRFKDVSTCQCILNCHISLTLDQIIKYNGYQVSPAGIQKAKQHLQS